MNPWVRQLGAVLLTAALVYPATYARSNRNSRVSISSSRLVSNHPPSSPHNKLTRNRSNSHPRKPLPLRRMRSNAAGGRADRARKQARR